jgi:hypothetical protein
MRRRLLSPHAAMLAFALLWTLAAGVAAWACCQCGGYQCQADTCSGCYTYDCAGTADQSHPGRCEGAGCACTTPICFHRALAPCGGKTPCDCGGNGTRAAGCTTTICADRCKNAPNPCGGSQACTCVSSSQPCDSGVCPAFCKRVTSCPASGCEKIDCGYKPKWADTDSRGCRKYGAAWGHCKGMGAGSLYAGACSNANLSYHCWRNTSWTKPCTVYGDWCCGGCEHAGLVLTGCPAYAPGRGGCEPDGKSHCMCGNSSCKGPPDDDHGDQKANCNCTQATCNKPVGSWCGGGCQVCGWHNTQGCPGSATCRGVSGMGCQGCVSWPNCRDYWQDPCGYAGQCGDPNCI